MLQYREIMIWLTELSLKVVVVTAFKYYVLNFFNSFDSFDSFDSCPIDIWVWPLGGSIPMKSSAQKGLSSFADDRQPSC